MFAIKKQMTKEFSDPYKWKTKATSRSVISDKNQFFTKLFHYHFRCTFLDGNKMMMEKTEKMYKYHRKRVRFW